MFQSPDRPTLKDAGIAYACKLKKRFTASATISEVIGGEKAIAWQRRHKTNLSGRSRCTFQSKPITHHKMNEDKRHNLKGNPKIRTCFKKIIQWSAQCPWLI